jgi:hypothetical protein
MSPKARREKLMGKLIAALATSALIAASFVDIASAGWSW